MKNIAFYTILIGSIIVSLIDLYLIASGRPPISQIMTLGTESPVFTFTLGFLCGHWIGSRVYKK